MSARRVLDLDFDEIYKWLFVRGAPLPAKELFPKVGFIVDGVACGFLYLTDSSVGIIDLYISNPDSTKESRDNALNSITECLIGMARFHRLKLLKCDSKIQSIKDRAKRFGFKEIGAHDSFSMEIR